MIIRGIQEKKKPRNWKLKKEKLLYKKKRQELTI